jgi:hypothetical protein
VTGAGSKLRLASAYVKRPRSTLPSIVPFRLLSDMESRRLGDACRQGTSTQAESRVRSVPSWAVALVLRGDERGGEGEKVICLAALVSPQHLVTTRRCIVTRYLARIKGEGKRLGRETRVHPLDLRWGTPNLPQRRIEFIAWARVATGGSNGRTEANSELAIIQLTDAGGDAPIGSTTKPPNPACMWESGTRGR